MAQRLGHRPVAVIALAALGLAACAGGGSDVGSSDPAAPVTDGRDTAAGARPGTVSDGTEPTGTEPTGTGPTGTERSETEPGDTRPEGDIDAIRPSLIRIETIGTIRDPEVGLSASAGRGSGFIISDDGLAVTNNHVVTGADTLEVFIGGDDGTSYNATVLGASECHDLALIDIDEDGPLTPLPWHDGEITTGMDVYAGGFPLDDPRFTLTGGIISETGATRDAGTWSLDSTLEHDAHIEPGSSGGPLVTPEGAVVGINYAGGGSGDTGPFFAIGKDQAQEIIDRLKEGDFESIGINGYAVADEGAGIHGVWVSGVTPGSPAHDVGLVPGDVLQSMNGRAIGTDGTMADYCDVIRTSGETPIRIEALRLDTAEMLAGEIYGDDPLEVTFSSAQAFEEKTTLDEAATTYDSYTTMVDDTGALTVDLPTAWTSLDTAPAALADGSLLPQIIASPDLDLYYSGWEAPGIFFTSVPNADILQVLATFAPTGCTDGGQSTHHNSRFLGTHQLWLDCGGTGTDFLVLGAAKVDGSGDVAVMTAQIVTEADLDALDQAFASFNTTS